MNRNELLTKLAKELGEWPDADRTYYCHLPEPWFWQWIGLALKERVASHPTRPSISMSDWLAERERLINKPSWDDAPEWADYLAQDADGIWHWYESEPREASMYWGISNVTLERWDRSSRGAIPGGHDWKDTLEQRPTEWPSEERIEAIGQNGPSGEHYEDDEFRQCERRLREAELLRHITPAELVNRQLVQRCDELQESNARLADENQRLRRIIGEMCA